MQIAVVDNVLVRLAGKQAAATIVCLHSFADSGAMFEPLLRTPLAQRYRVLAVDLPGFGASPRKDGVGTIAEHAELLVALLKRLVPQGPIGLIGHSIGSPIAVEIVPGLSGRLMGLFSIEGNLTAQDAYFTGLAADYDDPAIFKQAFLEQIWEMAQTQPILRRYHASAVLADERAMWDLGRDARRISAGDRPGQAYAAVQVPSLYYWSPDNTAAATQDWIEASGIANRQFTRASHWPSVDRPEATAEAIAGFFDSIQPPA